MNRTCPQCARSFPIAGARKYCTAECFRLARNARNAFRSRRQTQANLAEKSLTPCKMCGSPIGIRTMQSKFCSRDCSRDWRQAWSPKGKPRASKIWFTSCTSCSQPFTARVPNAIRCKECRRAYNEARLTRKYHERRAVGKMTMTVQALARRDGPVCWICTMGVDMSLSGSAPMGPTIDHLLPISKGGTNDKGNLALAHRSCNMRRGNRVPTSTLMVA